MSENLKTLQDSVALKPIQFDHNKGETRETASRFMGTDKLSLSLIPADVVFNSKTFKAGQKVFLRSDVYQAPQLKTTYKLGEQEFVLLPEAMVVMVAE